MHRYIGRTVDVIYEDRHGQLSQRRIRVQTIRDGMVRAYDLTKRSPRVFKLDSILAAELVRLA